MRALLCALFVASVYALVVTRATPVPDVGAAAGGPCPGVALDPLMYDYIVQNFERDTGSHNAVAAILLNYRMYDTLFEALILLTAIIGMTQFLPRAADIEAGRQAHRRAVADAAVDAPSGDAEDTGHA